MAFVAVIMGLGLLSYMLLGFRKLLSPKLEAFKVIVHAEGEANPRIERRRTKRRRKTRSLRLPMVQGFGSRVFGFKVLGFGFRVLGVGLWV